MATLLPSEKISIWRDKWLRLKDGESLSWLYNNVIAMDNGPRAYDEITRLLGAPTHTVPKLRLSEYTSDDGHTVLLFEWGEIPPRTLVAWKQQ